MSTRGVFTPVVLRPHVPGRVSGSNPLQYVGMLAALVAAVGYVALGWRFGEPNGTVPFALGVVGVVVAVGWTLYCRIAGES